MRNLLYNLLLCISFTYTEKQKRCSIFPSYKVLKTNSKTPVFAVNVLNKVEGVKPTLLEKRLRHRRSPLNFEKFSRAHFFMKHLQCLLLIFRNISKEYNSGNIINAVSDHLDQIPLLPVTPKEKSIEGTK